MSKIEALLKVIHICEENPRLVRALEDLLIEDGPVKVEPPENGAAPKQQEPKETATDGKPEAATQIKEAQNEPGEKDAASKQHKPTPKKAAPAATQKKPGREPVDTGRIKALRQGGWTVAEIADDTGCSQQTVRNNLAKLGMK